MRYKLLGRSGLRVSELCLGTMTFGNQGWGTEEAEAARLYSHYRDQGGNFLDTANEIYAGGASEQMLGRLLQGHRDQMVVTTKYSLALPGGQDINAGGNHRKSLHRSVEASLRRLGTDYIDLLWVHAWDALTPVEEMLRALDDLVSQGQSALPGHFQHAGLGCGQMQYIGACQRLDALYRHAGRVQLARAFDRT